jgi:hypothetical protein
MRRSFKAFFVGLGVVFGFIGGLVYQIWLSYSAPVALKIRPNLINLTFWEAVVSGHFSEWLWLVNRSASWALQIVGVPILTGLVFYIIWWSRQ